MHKLNQTKQILNEWKQFIINESTAGRVLEMIDTLEQHNQKILIKDRNTHVIISFLEPPNQQNEFSGEIHCSSTSELVKTHSPIPHPKGTLHTTDLSKYLGIGKDETNSTWYVTWTETNKTGLGPLLYETLMEYINDKKNAALKPDADSVSGDAISVWEKFDARDDIKSIQLDIDINSLNIYKLYGNTNIKQLTNKDPTDDTKQTSAASDKSPELWHQSSLSRSYRKINPNIIKTLENKNLLIFT
jgi:hypothetical protein